MSSCGSWERDFRSLKGWKAQNQRGKLKCEKNTIFLRLKINRENIYNFASLNEALMYTFYCGITLLKMLDRINGIEGNGPKLAVNLNIWFLRTQGTEVRRYFTIVHSARYTLLIDFWNYAMAVWISASTLLHPSLRLTESNTAFCYFLIIACCGFFIAALTLEIF